MKKRSREYLRGHRAAKRQVLKRLRRWGSFVQHDPVRAAEYADIILGIREEVRP